jgi:large subunit ribosomal protein L22
MEIRSIHRYARISAFKAREVTREIQGLPVSAALDVLAFTPKKAAILVNQTLKSAIANAENNANLKADGLIVKEAIVGEGPTFKRMSTRARGSGARILKRTSHIRIVLTDEKPEKAEQKTEEKAAPAAEKKPKKTKKTAKAAAKK